jgi:predicted  nucleic acid-binding Zn-ribbon protein
LPELSSSLEQSNRFFHEERERLERWAEDMVLGAEKELADTKAQLRALGRQARVATTTGEQHALQLKIRELERVQRRQRQRIFDVEDEIKDKRDALIDDLEARLVQRTEVMPLFTIRWSVV